MMADILQSEAQSQLRQFVEQIERLEEDKATVATDIREKYNEAQASGFDKKAIRQIIKIRNKSPGELAEEEAIIDVYKHALGMIDE
jgi:uncharacterized protein (UPF0335 family)